MACRRSRPEHRPRGGRSPRRGPGGPYRAALDGEARRAARLHLRRAREAHQPVRERPRGLGVVKGSVSSCRRAHSRALHRSAGHAKNGSVFSPLFSAFGPEPIASRWRSARPRPGHHRRALPTQGRRMRASLPGLGHVFWSARPERPRAVPGTCDLQHLMAQADGHFEIAPTDPEDLALLHFTSGTTGTPKGAVHVHEAVVAHHATGRFALDLHPDDVFWCTADPGLGDRHVLRHHRAADARRDQHRRRGRLRRRALVPHPAAARKSPSGTRRRPRSAC